jgi:hypothetical protein
VAIHDDRAVVVFFEPVDAADQGRFSGPGGAANNDPLALFYGQSDIFKRLKITEKFVDVLKLDNVFTHFKPHF